ncbi:hypothetical protein O3P69_008259 [Scylla paramamosain]|uniref:Uncharacterized protein n=1 Tax=Scylla paramamosain TaxID=85552 RepID=A0AAW0T1C5_SCYPA
MIKLFSSCQCEGYVHHTTACVSNAQSRSPLRLPLFGVTRSPPPPSQSHAGRRLTSCPAAEVMRCDDKVVCHYEARVMETKVTLPHCDGRGAGAGTVRRSWDGSSLTATITISQESVLPVLLEVIVAGTKREEGEEEEEEEAPRAYLKTSRYDDNSLATVQLTHFTPPSRGHFPAQTSKAAPRVTTTFFSTTKICSRAATKGASNLEHTREFSQCDEGNVFIGSEFAVQSHKEFVDAGDLKCNYKNGGREEMLPDKSEHLRCNIGTAAISDKFLTKAVKEARMEVLATTARVYGITNGKAPPRPATRRRGSCQVLPARETRHSYTSG